ncbi:DUF3482 domain-containing protein [Aliikangiella sp. IMCC44632]
MRPSFAVVGHPNKGKSSIVSTLSRNDSVVISQRSGTTEKANQFRVETANAGYELIDTPGFQRPSRVLAWLTEKNVSADKRAAVVNEFVNNLECQQQFPDEVELLRPITQGAAILYVVDGSRPYGREYEAEMEILRWTGQPSMALINPIESDDYVIEWENALTQYFKTVRVFNPMQASFESQLELLQTFSHINPKWGGQLEQLVKDLQAERTTQKQQAVLLLSRLLEDMCTFKVTQKVVQKSQAESLKPLLAKRFSQAMIAKEKEIFATLLTLYSHQNVKVELNDFDLPPDLFDCEQWYLWGLNKQQLAIVGAMSGAVAGAAADLAVAGHSFMLGAIGGGLLGFGGVVFGADKIATSQVKGIPVGGYEAQYGPIKNRNFPYVVIGRFLYLYTQINQRTHAVRNNIVAESSALKARINSLESSDQRALHLACDKLCKQKEVDDLYNLLIKLF